MGLLRRGCDELVDLAAGAEGTVVGAEEAGAEGAGTAAGGPTGATAAGGGECIITTGAADGGWGKASFLRIISSQSSCFICNSTISLESTSFTRLAT